MQGKGLIKFFLVLILLVITYQFLLILPTRSEERKAEAYGVTTTPMNPEIGERYFLDSIANKSILNLVIKKYTYQELKKQQLALGLDLQGGMSVVMQVDLVDLVKKMSGGSNDPEFLAATKSAKEQMTLTSGQDYISLFRDAYNKQAPGKGLANIFAANRDLSEEININSTDDEVVQLLRSKGDETVARTFELMKKRIDKLGVMQPNVTLDERVDRIIVELPGVRNPERAKEYLQGTAKLQFWEVYRSTDQEIAGDLNRIDAILKAANSTSEDQKEEIPTITDIDSSKMEFDDLGNRKDEFYTQNRDALDAQAAKALAVNNSFSNEGPLLSKLRLTGPQEYGQAVHGVANARDTAELTSLLKSREVMANLPGDVLFQWSAKPARDDKRKFTGEYMLYAMKTNRRKAAPLEGDKVIDADRDLDQQNNEYVVNVAMSQEGAKIWGKMTEKNVNREIAIVLDGEVISAPNVNEPIKGGRSRITGNFAADEATEFSNLLKVGALPADTEIIESSIVGPTMGASNVKSGLMSLAVGVALVLLFMILYYGSGGVFSIIALIANLFFIIGALSSIGTVLTMAGIAGIVLTIGMAVDANVIIYERIREELRAGKHMGTAIRDGFQASYSAIIDANVTTILTAMVLAYFGTGPIKGFAVVLIVGVLCSLFAAVLLTRLMIEWWTSKDRGISFSTPMFKNAFANMNFDFVGKGKIALIGSGIFILIGLGSMLTRGFELGVDFTGGRSYTVLMDNDIDTDKMRSTLTGVFADAAPIVKTFGSSNQIEVTTSYMIDDISDEADKQVLTALYNGVNQYAGGNISRAQFDGDNATNTILQRSSKTGPTIADDILKSSILSTIVALLLIFAYIWIRFRKWQYSLGAVAALFHDVLILLSIFSLLRGILPFSLEINQAFIAALLTVVGYSINDTVVVFDRIREFFDSYTGKSKKEVINLGVNNTISRTVITSLTTLFVVLILFIFGGAVIRGFAFALLIGILAGTYSSVFIATPVVNLLTKEGDLKKVKTASSGKKGYQRKVAAE